MNYTNNSISENYEIPDFMGKAICMIGIIALFLMEGTIIPKRNNPILPITRHDKCLASGVAKSPSAFTTMKRNTSYTGFPVPESV